MRVQCLLAKGGHFNQQTKKGRAQWEITTCNRYARELNRAHPYKIIIIHVENLHQPCQLFEHAVLGEKTQKKKMMAGAYKWTAAIKAVRAEGCRRQVRVAKAALGSDRPNLSPNIDKHK